MENTLEGIHQDILLSIEKNDEEKTKKLIEKRMLIFQENCTKENYKLLQIHIQIEKEILQNEMENVASMQIYQKENQMVIQKYGKYLRNE